MGTHRNEKQHKRKSPVKAKEHKKNGAPNKNEKKPHSPVNSMRSDKKEEHSGKKPKQTEKGIEEALKEARTQEHQDVIVHEPTFQPLLRQIQTARCYRLLRPPARTSQQLTSPLMPSPCPNTPTNRFSTPPLIKSVNVPIIVPLQPEQYNGYIAGATSPQARDGKSIFADKNLQPMDIYP
ncbi:unnamed protein product [Strongylus vulgaris]|uniref:Uncharacterized protein n=1 Tax=Strongylus vulgaris TaxID=40348 RepID=A0A3P7IT31_STRVU|nr:unnamed protein product [Strongylus vulgaris]